MLLTVCPACGGPLCGVRDVRVCFAHHPPRWFDNAGAPAAEPEPKAYDPTRRTADAEILYRLALTDTDARAAIAAEDMAREYSE